MRGKKGNHRRGIFLIGVLFVVVLVTMFVGASIDLAPWALKRASNHGDWLRAQRAARNGVEYAVARLRANPDWRANHGTTAMTTIVDQPGLTVVEGRGNVIGLVRSGDQVSQFRMRFNYQDGDGGADLLDNPGALAIDLPLVSYNNVLVPSQRPVPKADGPNASVPATPTIHTSVPAHGVFLVCEGRSGPWLSQATASNPNPAVPAFGRVSQVRVETVYKVNNIGQAVTPAVVSSASDFIAELPQSTAAERVLELDSADTSVVGRLRTRKSLKVTGGDSQNIRASEGKSGEFREREGYTASPASNVSRAEESDIDSFYNLKWSDVRKADGTHTLAGGVYTVWDDGSLHYYDMTMADYRQHIAANPNDPGGTVNLPDSIKTSSEGGIFKFIIEGDTQVTGTNPELVLIPKKGADAGEGAGGEPDEAAWATALTTDNTAGIKADPGGGNNYEYQGAIRTLIERVVDDKGGFDGGGYFDFPSGNWSIQKSSTKLDLRGQSFGAYEGLIAAELAPMIMEYVQKVGTADPAVASALSVLNLSAGSSTKEIPEVASDTTTPQKIVVEFAPKGSASAVLSGESSITLGARVEGEGGSITAGGDIKLIGLGVNLAALDTPNEGVSLYSKKDISISTYDKAQDKYWDVGLKGVIYSWGNFQALLGARKADGTDHLPAAKWGTMQLNGALVAYGKDPADTEGAAAAGKVEIFARRANLKYDPSYLLSVMGTLPGGVGYGRVWWMQH